MKSLKRSFINLSSELNTVVGVLAFALAIEVVGMENTRLYGFLSLFFVMAVWFAVDVPYRRNRERWIADRPKWYTGAFVVRRLLVLFLGLTALALVATGFLTTHGFTIEGAV